MLAADDLQPWGWKNMRQIAITIGYSSVNLLAILKMLAQHASRECYCVERVDEYRDEPYLYPDGVVRAEELAVRASFKYHAPLCIGIVAVWSTPNRADLRPAWLEVATLIERGDLKKPLALTPCTTHNASVPHCSAGLFPDETHYSEEAVITLMETIKTRHRTLHLV